MMKHNMRCSSTRLHSRQTFNIILSVLIDYLGSIMLLDAVWIPALIWMKLCVSNTKVHCFNSFSLKIRSAISTWLPAIKSEPARLRQSSELCNGSTFIFIYIYTAENELTTIGSQRAYEGRALCPDGSLCSIDRVNNVWSGPYKAGVWIPSCCFGWFGYFATFQQTCWFFS